MATTSARKPRTTPAAKKTTTSRKTSVPVPAPTDAAETGMSVPVVVQSEAPVVSGPEMKKKELVDLVVERSGIKKRDVKPAIEAALAILGDALASGRDLNLAPLGKIKVTRQKRLAKALVLNARVRQNDEVEAEELDPLAQAAE
jgi:DNA-binding protein HU-alpha